MKIYSLFLRVSLCILALQIFYLFGSTYSAPSRVGRQQQSLVMTPKEKATYKELRKQEREKRIEEFDFSPNITYGALDNPLEWARTFVTIYELPDWEKQYTGNQINEFINQIHQFLISLQKSKFDKIGLLKASEELPANLSPRLKSALKKSLTYMRQVIKDDLAEIPLKFVVTTANILGIFNDPFEFAGDYGDKIEPLRQIVFHYIVSEMAKATNKSESEIEKEAVSRESLIEEAAKKDKEYGPTLTQVVTPKLFEKIKNKLTSLGIKPGEISALEQFIKKYGDQKIFSLLRSEPLSKDLKLLSLDKDLKDYAKEQGKDFVMPILSSTTKLEGEDSEELKLRLIDALFTKEVFDRVKTLKSESKLKKAIEDFNTKNPDFLKNYLKNAGNTNELILFSTPAGQAFFYWLYQSLNFDLLFSQPETAPITIAQVNQVKTAFAETLGNAQARANTFREKLLAIDSKVLFAQEVDKNVIDTLTKDALFLPPKQEFQDAIVLLKSGFWEPDYEVIKFNNYPRYDEGVFTAVLARHADTQQLFLLVSGHGHAKEAKDARDQLQLAVSKADQLSKEREETVFLIMGVDANTKISEQFKDKDVKDFKEALRNLGLVSTQVGPTTVKTRMVTTQHDKAARPVLDEEDYIIVKQDQLFLGDTTVGFGALGVKVDPTVQLPNIDNQSDHYAVSTTIRNQAATQKMTQKQQSKRKKKPL